MSVKETLIKARTILAARGINRDGWYVDGEGCKVCAMGSMYMACGAELTPRHCSDGSTDYFFSDIDLAISSETYVPAVDLLLKVLAEETDITIITKFNDRSSTDDEVLEIFDKAIARAS